jgi:hypothetical protein
LQKACTSRIKWKEKCSTSFKTHYLGAPDANCDEILFRHSHATHFVKKVGIDGMVRQTGSLVILDYFPKLDF